MVVQLRREGREVQIGHVIDQVIDEVLEHFWDAGHVRGTGWGGRRFGGHVLRHALS
jgi:hypothetical protein